MPPLPLLVFVVGTGSLGAEIAAVRLMSPYFGASTIVWANTIGVVLVALSIGYWLGGRYGDRHPHMRGLCMLTLGSAVLLAAVPFVADPLMGLAVGALDSISAGAFLGSLFARPRPGGHPGASHGRGHAVGAPAGRAGRRARGQRGRAPLRALDRRQPGRHAPVRARSDPGVRHPSHLPDLRSGHRGHSRDGAAPGLALGSGARGDRGADRPAGGHAEGWRRRAA